MPIAVERSSSRKILIAPLDWGLGHATRCIPVINELINQECEVQIATSAGALILLKDEFPTLTFHEIVSYNVHYSKILPLSLSLFLQIPKFLRRIKTEHSQIENLVKENKIDFVISDNRYGGWTKLIPCVFITHQVNILMPSTLQWMQSLVNYFNHRLIRKYDYCWVPDEPQDRITGRLTESKNLAITFVGMLSRFERRESKRKKNILLILLSGPEPQRTIFEKTIQKKLLNYASEVVVVRGLPEETNSRIDVGENVVQFNHLSATELNKLIEESELIVSRSGYSTIMDLAKLNKKAIFIPTPGQTEQEYLAEQLMKQKIAYSTNLNDLDLNRLEELISEYSGFKGEYTNSHLVKAIKELLA